MVVPFNPTWVRVTGSYKYHVFKQVKNRSGEPVDWNPYRSLCSAYWLTTPNTQTHTPEMNKTCAECHRRFEQIYIKDQEEKTKNRRFTSLSYKKREARRQP